MAKSKKRKQNAPLDAPNKHLKTSKLITPPLEGDGDSDGTALEPTSLHSVISEEELDITVETLATLAQHPSLIKSKACKDLRVAVYDFRQACPTGVNSARSLPS